MTIMFLLTVFLIWLFLLILYYLPRVRFSRRIVEIEPTGWATTYPDILASDMEDYPAHIKLVREEINRKLFGEKVASL